jgi:hypothetical protein
MLKLTSRTRLPLYIAPSHICAVVAASPSLTLVYTPGTIHEVLETPDKILAMLKSNLVAWSSPSDMTSWSPSPTAGSVKFEDLGAFRPISEAVNRIVYRCAPGNVDHDTIEEAQTCPHCKDIARGQSS